MGIGNLMRAGDMTAYNQMATMYTIEHAISKLEYGKRLKESISKKAKESS